MDKLPRCSSGTACGARACRRPRATGTRKPGPLYSFFGATPDSWIGKLWPRGRAWQNNLSTGHDRRQFLQSLVGRPQLPAPPYNGSEVSVEPDGAVYPCCVKTQLPMGSLLEDNLIDILDSLAGVPAYEAITMATPSGWASRYGWSEERFLAQSHTSTPNGTPYQNLCIGCDRFHEQVLGPVLEPPGCAGATARQAMRRSSPTH